MIKLRNNLVYGCRVRDAQLCKDVSIQKIHVILIVILYKTAILCSLASGYESKSKSCVARKKNNGFQTCWNANIYHILDLAILTCPTPIKIGVGAVYGHFTW
jgi:hypothetical protein